MSGLPLWHPVCTHPAAADGISVTQPLNSVQALVLTSAHAFIL